MAELISFFKPAAVPYEPDLELRREEPAAEPLYFVEVLEHLRQLENAAQIGRRNQQEMICGRAQPRGE